MRVLLTLILILSGPINAQTDYQCQDEKGSQYDISLTGQFRTLSRTQKSGSKTSFLLSPANFIHDLESSQGRNTYSGLREGPEPFLQRVDMSHEVSIKYSIADGKSTTLLSLLFEGDFPKGLVCHSIGSIENVVVPRPKNSAETLAIPFRYAISRQNREGNLLQTGLLQVERALILFSHLSSSEQNNFLAQFKDEINSISPDSVTILQKRLPKNIGTLFNTILSLTNYKQHPITYRYIQWTNSAFEFSNARNYNAIHAALTQFVASPAFKIEKMKELFDTATKDVLGELDEIDVNFVRRGMSPRASEYFLVLWSQGFRKQALALYPRVESWVSELVTLIEHRSIPKNKGKIYENIMTFYKSEESLNRTVHQLYVKAVAPLAQQLSTKNREDIRAWFPEEERMFWDELIHPESSPLLRL